MTNPDQTSVMVHEAVGVFDNAENLQQAVDRLQEQGFDRAEISVLASEVAIKEKLGHIYQRIEEAEDDPESPRAVFVAKETLGDIEGAIIGTPLYIAAAATGAAVVATGGTLLGAILATTAAGAAGTAIGIILAKIYSDNYAEYIQNQINRGGLLLWVHLKTPDEESKAKAILEKYSARDVHVHEVPVF